MSHQYAAIGWNRQKRLYDLVLLAGIFSYLGIFIALGNLLFPFATAETLIIRAAGSAAFLLLHIVLCIGPLCRLDSRFLPLLYNRRHLGVATFLLGAVHGIFGIIQFHSLGDKNPLVSLLTANRNFASLAEFPFQQLGFFALVILFLMAATSHDFWLRNLTPPVWKFLHMLVYVAYASLVGHVTLGLLQSETSPLLAIATGLGLIIVIGLHIAAASRENKVDSAQTPAVQRGIRRCLRGREHSGKMRNRCFDSGRASRDLQVRRESIRDFQRLPSPERTFGRRQDHRWMCDLPVAWLSISAGKWSFSAALHGESRDFQNEDCRRPRPDRSQPA